MGKKILGIILLLFAMLCILGAFTGIAFLTRNYFKIEWWEDGLILSGIILCWMGFAVFMFTGLNSLGIY